MIAKADAEHAKLRCCFCGSEDSNFEDWNNPDKKVYFDASVAGFHKNSEPNAEPNA